MSLIRTTSPVLTEVVVVVVVVVVKVVVPCRHSPNVVVVVMPSIHGSHVVLLISVAIVLATGISTNVLITGMQIEVGDEKKC